MRILDTHVIGSALLCRTSFRMKAINMLFGVNRYVPVHLLGIFSYYSEIRKTDVISMWFIIAAIVRFSGCKA